MSRSFWHFPFSPDTFKLVKHTKGMLFFLIHFWSEAKFGYSFKRQLKKYILENEKKIPGQFTWNGAHHQLNKLAEQGQFISKWHESAIGFSSDVTNAGATLCAQGCRSIEIIIVMWPFISQPAPSSLILFYSQHRDLIGRRGVGRGGGGLEGHQSDCIYYSQKLWVPFVPTIFRVLWWRLFSSSNKVLRALNRFHVWYYSLFRFEFILQQSTITVVNTPLFALNMSFTLWHLLKRVKSGPRGKPPTLLSTCAIMEFHANKLSRHTVTVQWLGSTPVTWQ